jgi:hypothetical protein
MLKQEAFVFREPREGSSRIFLSGTRPATGSGTNRGEGHALFRFSGLRMRMVQESEKR